MPDSATKPVNVDHVLPEVTDMMPQWATVRDCIDGQHKIKKKGTSYLPMPNPTDKSTENVARYGSYIARAIFTNMTSRTLNGMVGTVFMKEPVATLPDALMPLYDNVDGGAVTLDQQARQVLSDTLSVGRCGLLTDYPSAQTDDKGKRIAFTRDQTSSGEIRPVIQFYFAEDIINWRYVVVNSVRKLSLVVLHEKYVAEDDGFKKVDNDQWRVLRLRNNVYTVEIYRRMQTGIEVFTPEFTPTQANGQPFDHILFEFVGSRNNDGGIDEAPLLDLANLNIGHYHNSADFEEMCFILGQPTTVISGLTYSWIRDVFGVYQDGDAVEDAEATLPPGKKALAMGSTQALLLPEGATAQYLQVNESQLSMKAMEHKERQAVALGARLVSQQTVQRTAKEAGMEDAAEQSTLLSAAKNVNSAYRRCLEAAALFTGAAITDDMGYELNTDFEILTLDTAAIQARVKMWIDGAITWTEMRSILRRANIATEDDKAAKSEIEADALAQAEAMGFGETGEPVPPGEKKPPPKDDDKE